jgi:glutamyl-tRNA reductase
VPVLTLGVSYRRAPVELLERLAVPEDDEPKAYRRLDGLDAVREAVILSTCNRVEVVAEVPLYHQGFQDLKRFLTEHGEVPIDELAEPLYAHYEDEAAEHLFRVASGLDSMVLGEPQILAQVRAAFRRADAEGAAGPVLADLFRWAVRTGRRVRAETAIGAAPGAFVEAGSELAAEQLGGLLGRAALIVGAGEMGALAARTLRDRGVGDILVLSRRPGRAERLAARVGGRHGPLDLLDEGLARAELVVSSTGATGPVISAAAVRRARRDARGMQFILDLAVPRDVDPQAAGVPGVTVADIDDLGEVVARRGGQAPEEVDRARDIVRQEVRRYATARRAARLAPLIEALHARGEQVRAAEIRRMAGRLAALPDRDRKAVDALTRRIVRRLLHEPVVKLKEQAGKGGADAAARALADLFDLDRPE